MSNTSMVHPFEERKQFISYFFNIASHIKNSPRLMQGNAMFVSLNGEPNTGKFLAALAMDMGMSPERYPNLEISRDTNIHGDAFLSPKNASLVCFHGSDPIILEHREAHDEYLQAISANAPQAKIHIISNLKRRSFELPNYRDDFSSDVLDMGITVKKDDVGQVKSEDSFYRIATVTTRKQSLLSKIVRSVKP